MDESSRQIAEELFQIAYNDSYLYFKFQVPFRERYKPLMKIDLYHRDIALTEVEYTYTPAVIREWIKRKLLAQRHENKANKLPAPPPTKINQTLATTISLNAKGLATNKLLTWIEDECKQLIKEEKIASEYKKKFKYGSVNLKGHY
jgi:hypothetical protein